MTNLSRGRKNDNPRQRPNINHTGIAEVEKMTSPGQRLTNDRPNTAEIGKITTSVRDWKNATLGRGRKMTTSVRD
jgi:hypothetical protein